MALLIGSHTCQGVIDHKPDTVFAEAWYKLGLDRSSDPIVHSLIYSREYISFGLANSDYFCDL